MTVRYEELGKKVKEYRKIKKYSTSELATKLGVSVGWLNQLENGKSDGFKLKLLHKLTNELEVPVEELLCIDAINKKNITINVNGDLDIILKNLNGSSSDLEILKGDLKILIEKYINLIIKYGDEEGMIKTITQHLVNEIQFVEKINKIKKSS